MHRFSKHYFSKDGTSCHYYFQDSFGQATIVAHCLHEQEPKVRKEAADFHSSPRKRFERHNFSSRRLEAVITLRSLSVSGANALGSVLSIV